MTIPVDVRELAEQLARYEFAYFVTVGEDNRAHLVAATPVLDGDRLVVGGLGRHSTANATARPAVTLVWPPAEAAGYSLIVDGTATVDGDTASVTPTRAVLHRPGPGAGGRPGCTSDCQPIDLGGG